MEVLYILTFVGDKYPPLPGLAAAHRPVLGAAVRLALGHQSFVRAVHVVTLL